MVSFSRGELFPSMLEFERKKDVYCNENFIVLYKRDSRTIDNAKKRGSIKTTIVNPALMYYEIHYSCVHGGKKYESRSKGQRSCR